MKKDLLWTKTVLSVYRFLERLCGSIDKIIMQSALASSDILGYNFHRNNTLAISQKLIDLSERKVTLINLKILIENILSELPIKDSTILIQRYFDETKIKDIALKQDISIRSVFRNLEQSETAFARKLSFKGYDEKKMFDFLKNEAWILNAYSRIEESGEQEFSLSNSMLAKVAQL